MRHGRLAALVIAASLAATAPVLAQDKAEQARVASEKAVQAYREARYKEAIELFEQANRLAPHPDLMFNIGQAYEKMGDVANALRAYKEYLRLAPAASDRATVEASIKNLEGRLQARGVQQVRVASTPPGAKVVVDGKELGTTPWTGELAPGRHTLVLRVAGKPDASRTFDLSKDRALAIDVDLSTTAAPADEGGIKPWTIVALGLGVAGLGAAVGFEVARQGAEDDALADPTQVGYADAYETMEQHQTLSRVFVGVGGGLLVLGGVFLAIDLAGSSGPADEAPAGEPKAKAGLGCGGPACGVFVAGRF